MRVLFFSPDYDVSKEGPLRPLWSGAAYYRCIAPCAELTRHGVDTWMTPILLSNDQTGKFAGVLEGDSMIDDADIVVVHSWKAAGAADQIERARRTGQIVIGDVDDLFWALPAGHRGTTWNPTKLRAANWNHLRANLNACDAITVSTQAIKDWIEMNWSSPPPVFVVSNALDIQNFTPEPFRKRIKTVGWNGNLAWRDDDMKVVRKWLGKFLEDNDLRFVWNGGTEVEPFAKSLGIDPERVEVRVQLPFFDWRESRPLRNVDLQIIPLELPSDFNRAKSALKGMESAAWGVPFIASPSPEYVRVFGVDPTEPLQLAAENCLDRNHREWLLVREQADLDLQDLRDRWFDWREVYERFGG